MRLAYLRKSIALSALIMITGCAFEPVKTGYSKSQVQKLIEPVVEIHDSLLVFRTSGYKIWEYQEAEFFVNGEPAARFKGGGASYLPLKAGKNTITVREPEHFLTCELEFEFEPGANQFVEIYERFDPGAVVMSVLFADLHSRLAYNPHPEAKCAGVFGLSMGYLEKDQFGEVEREFSFQVVQR